MRSPGDLRGHILIHDESIPSAGKGPIWGAWLKLAGVDGIDIERGPRFSNTLLVFEAVLEGQGVALVPWPLIEADVAAGRLDRALSYGGFGGPGFGPGGTRRSNRDDDIIDLDA